MDTPATSRKRPASSPLNAEAHQPTVSVGSISPPRASRSAPTLLHSQVSVVEWQCKNEVSIHRTARHFSIEGVRNRGRKCRIPRISPPLRFVLRLRLQKGGGRICGTLRYKNVFSALKLESSSPVQSSDYRRLFMKERF